MVEEELVTLLNGYFDKGINISVGAYAVGVVITVVSAGVGAYLSSFLKRSGELSAVKRSLDDTIAQLKKQTAAVEDVKSEIANRAWIEQKKWEFRKDLYVELIRGMLKIRDECLRAEEIMGEVSSISEECEVAWDKQKNRIMSRAESVYDVEVKELTDDFRKIFNERGALFLGPNVVQVLKRFFEAEEIRTKESWLQFRADVIKGVATPYDCSGYDCYELALAHKSVAAENAYRALLFEARSDLKIRDV